MKTINKILSTLLLFSLVATIPLSQAMAHGDHAPPVEITEKQAKAKAQQDLSIIVKNKEKVSETVLDKSWLEIPMDTYQVSKRDSKRVLVDITSQAPAKTLRIILSIYGRYLGATMIEEKAK